LDHNFFPTAVLNFYFSYSYYFIFIYLSDLFMC